MLRQPQGTMASVTSEVERIKRKLRIESPYVTHLLRCFSLPEITWGLHFEDAFIPITDVSEIRCSLAEESGVLLPCGAAARDKGTGGE